MRVNILTRHDPIREHSLSSQSRFLKSAWTMNVPQRLARPISCLLLTSMIISQVVQHLLTGYKIEARFASHMPVGKQALFSKTGEIPRRGRHLPE
ncbi:hypothetical protein TNCV_1951351 [Trichonephila clavipes]|nr:hypothetical protein TNCV_1951351 [Trichonephila clavipes]